MLSAWTSRWHQFLTLCSSWFHIVQHVQVSCGSISALLQVIVRDRVGVQKPNHVRKCREETQQSWQMTAVAAGGLLWAAWHSWTGVQLLNFQKRRLYIFLGYVCRKVLFWSFGAYEGNTFNSNFCPFTECPEVCRVMCILWGLFERKGDLG